MERRLRLLVGLGRRFASTSSKKASLRIKRLENEELDANPVLFIQKYDKFIDVERFKAKDEDFASNTTKKVKFILEAVKKAPTYERLVEALSERPTATRFDPPTIINDENVSEASSRTVHIETDEEAELLQWSSTELDVKKLPSYYMMLSKSRLTLLVSTTAAGGYAMAPGAFIPTTFCATILGTALVSCAANSVNQFLEVPFDSQMNRTKNRVLVRRLLSTRHAMTFAAVSAVSGATLLAVHVNETAAALGVFNLFLYTSVYTPMKRVSIANTWVGSVVGAVPPLIGWAGCAGGITDPGAFVLGAVLFAWQFPHFNSLSWNLRPDYSRAGYRMMSVTDPALCRRVALRYSVGTIAICSGMAPTLGVTEWAFALESLPLNGYLTFLAWRFYKEADSNSSRKLFRFTLIHLPLLMTLMFISKKAKSHDDNKKLV